MITLRYLLVLMAFLFLGPLKSTAQTYPSFANDTVIVCTASERDLLPPEIDAADCEETLLGNVNPQGGHIWAFFTINVPDTLLESFEPLGLGVSAKASSMIYLNGREVGRTGLPGDTKQSETPGRMDKIFPLREGALKVGSNEIAIRMSSHHGLIKLSSPVHSVYVSRYEDPQSRRLRRYAPSLLPFGVFVIGSLYFLIMALVGRQKYRAVLLSLMSFLVAFQLFAEVSRGVFAYLYPFHDYRLIVILMCSALFGVSLSLYSARVFNPKKPRVWIALIVLVSITSLIVPSGFDLKSSASLLSQTFLSLIIAVSAIKMKKRLAIIFALFLSVFASVNILAPSLFLDLYFYYVLALLMLFLFAQQALAYGQEQALRQSEEIRANKLQMALDKKNAEKEDIVLSLSEAGKIHRVSAKDIVMIKGADDYIDVTLKTGKTRLISSTLTEIETQLPAYFLRTHRSYIVNMDEIIELVRETSGTGALKLSNSLSAPVSRRIMPAVRKALI